jgi:sarcosine oxidase
MVADVAVVGLRAMGSMSVWRLAARGARVVGFDRSRPPHDLGSSHGESRITRTAYYEGPWYVPLLRESFGLWRELEREASTELLSMTGALMIGRPDGELVSGALASARAHHLDHQVLDTAAARRRLPQHRLEDSEVALIEPSAGLLRPERCIEAALGRAAALGATLYLDTVVESLTPVDEGWACRTAAGVVIARQLVVAAGSRAGTLLPELAPLLSVERQVMAWFPVDDLEGFAPDRFPVFCHEYDGGRMCYGFPSLDGRTIKVAVHHDGPIVDPGASAQPVTAAELEPVVRFVEQRLHGVRPTVDRALPCRYTNTPDRHFIVDRLSQPGLTVLSACSGHGFKFACVLGDVVADLVLTGATSRDIEHFRLGRLDHVG